MATRVTRSAPAQSPLEKLRVVLEMIKIEHTLFALPFAFTGAILAANGLPSVWQICWILAAMVGARSAAMAFNRLVDRDFDAANPRTRMRAIPAGLVSVRFVIGFTAAAAAIFILAAFELNRLTLFLAPLALGIVFFYSYTKRFTAWSHAFLGLALAVAPVGAWIAVRGTLELTPLLLGAAVVCWLVGFDTIYALQDVAFDKQAGLNSLPTRYGPTPALWIARAFHALMIAFLVTLGYVTPLGIWYYAGVTLAAILIFAEHTLIKPDDLRRLNIAFYNLNIAVSLSILLSVCLDIYLRHN